MKKRLSLLLLIILNVSILYANSLYIGLEAGYSYSIIDTDTTYPNTYNLNGHGFDASIPIEYVFHENFSLNSGFRYIVKSSNYLKAFVDDTISDLYQFYHMLEFPLTFRIKAGNDTIKCYLGVGGYIGVRLFDHIRGELADWNWVMQEVNDVEKLNSYDNLFDAGLIGEAGITLSLNPTSHLYLALRYQYGLTSLVKGNTKSTMPTYFDNISVDLGYMWRIL